MGKQLINMEIVTNGSYCDRICKCFALIYNHDGSESYICGAFQQLLRRDQSDRKFHRCTQCLGAKVIKPYKKPRVKLSKLLP